jgi:hypothetical protein
MPRQVKQSNGTPDMRGLIVHYVRSKGGDITIAALLADPVIGALVPTLTLGDLGGQSTPVDGVQRGPKPTSVPTTRRRKGVAQTKTAEGRDAYDEQVLTAINAAREPVAAEQVIKDVGGTGLQFRTATQRLLSRKKIKRTGKARGTSYAAA